MIVSEHALFNRELLGRAEFVADAGSKGETLLGNNIDAPGGKAGAALCQDLFASLV